MHEWDKYIEDVQKKRRQAGELERLAVSHVVALRKRFEFDEDAAERMINLVHLFRHTKGKWRGKSFNLLPHQVFFIAFLFGLKNKEGRRLIREAMLNMAKKGGKSELVGAIAVLFTFFDGEKTAECYTAANKTEQALFSWKSAKGICTQLAEEAPNFAANFKYYDNRLDHVLIQPSSENFFKTLPYESKSLDGVNPHLAIIDEFHEYPDTSLPDNLQSGMVLREQPLLLYTTTRGFHPYGPLAQKEEYYTNVLKGLVDDYRVFPLIFSLDKYDNWQDKKTWVKACPGMPYGLPSEESLEAEQKAAIEEGGEKLVSCKTKNFNVWQRAKADFVSMSDWEKGVDPIYEKALHGRKCFTSFDIGRTDDLSAFGLLFPPGKEGGKFVYLLRVFMPEGLVEQRSREHKVSYRQWIDKGFITPTEGNFIDTFAVLQQVEEDARNFDFYSISADKTFAQELLNQLLVRGLPAKDYPQRYATMNSAIQTIQTMVGHHEIQHGGNPVLTWMCSNVAIKKDTGGRMMMDKSDRVTGKGSESKRTKRKIDGMVCLAMCIGDYLEWIKDNQPVVDEIRFL